jgi:hypothetical protein
MSEATYLCELWLSKIVLKPDDPDNYKLAHSALTAAVEEIHLLIETRRRERTRAEKAEERAENLSATLIETKKAFAKLYKTNITNEQKEELYVVRLFDGMDGEWMDVSDPVTKEEADKIWNEKTNNGTKNTKYEHIDYYDIFPADTKMLFSDGFSQTRRD